MRRCVVSLDVVIYLHEDSAAADPESVCQELTIAWDQVDIPNLGKTSIHGCECSEITRIDMT